MRFCLSNFSLKCASIDIQVFVAGRRDERALNTKRHILVRAKNGVFSLFLEYIFVK